MILGSERTTGLVCQRQSPRRRRGGSAMGFHLHLCRASENTEPLNKWREMHAEPLGTQEERKQALDGLFTVLLRDRLLPLSPLACYLVRQ